MRKPAIIALSGIAIAIVNLGILGYLVKTFGTLDTWDYEYVMVQIYFLFIAAALFSIGWIWNYLEYKQGKVKSYWGKNWEGA